LRFFGQVVGRSKNIPEIPTIDNQSKSQFIARLLHGEPAVVGLLAENPFPAAPPKFIRISLYEYRFASRAEWRQKENWWHSDLLWVGLPDNRGA